MGNAKDWQVQKMCTFISIFSFFLLLAIVTASEKPIVSSFNVFLLEIFNNTNNNLATVLITLGFSKAFDTINPGSLFVKLHYFSFDEKSIKFLTHISGTVIKQYQ